jgi:hypothetical protein
MNRDKLWEMIGNKIPHYLLNTKKCIYRNTKVRIKFNYGISKPIHKSKGVRCCIHTNTQFKPCNYIVKPHVSKVIGAALERLEV